jgi:L-glutamine:2-deoxy-scyllo-inosose/3-amino-2,3-dideoxy-scyllo-inosose aminotransferase
MRRDERETAEAYFNFVFRYRKEEFKGLPVGKFREALAAELGIEVESSYEPLNNCSLYVPHTKPARHKLSEAYWQEIDPARFDLLVCERIYQEEAVATHHKILLGSQEDMDQIAAAIRKIYDNAGELL